MIKEEGERFASQWVANWNAADLEAILSHYSEDACLSTAKAKALVGTSEIQGKIALRDYWGEGLRRARLHFVLREVLVKDDPDTVAIIYDSSINGILGRACEVFRFNADGLVASSEAYYGATYS